MEKTPTGSHSAETCVYMQVFTEEHILRHVASRHGCCSCPSLCRPFHTNHRAGIFTYLFLTILRLEAGMREPEYDVGEPTSFRYDYCQFGFIRSKSGARGQEEVRKYRSELLLPAFPHIMHTNIFLFSCFIQMCQFITELLLPAFPHFMHPNIFLFSCSIQMCQFITELLLPAFPRIMHQNIFLFSCFILMCQFIAE